MGRLLLQTTRMRTGGSYTLVKLIVSVSVYVGFIPYNCSLMPENGKKSTGRRRRTSCCAHSTDSRPCPLSCMVASTTPRPGRPRRAAVSTTSSSHLDTTTQSGGTLSTLNLSMDQLANVIRTEIDRSHTANADRDAADQQPSVGNQCTSSGAGSSYSGSSQDFDTVVSDSAVLQSSKVSRVAREQNKKRHCEILDDISKTHGDGKQSKLQQESIPPGVSSDEEIHLQDVLSTDSELELTLEEAGKRTDNYRGNEELPPILSQQRQASDVKHCLGLGRKQRVQLAPKKKDKDGDTGESTSRCVRHWQSSVLSSILNNVCMIVFIK